MSIWQRHAPWTVRSYAAALYAQTFHTLPHYWYWAAQCVFPRKIYWECSPTAAVLPGSPFSQATYLSYWSLFPVFATGAFSGYRKGAHLFMILLARGTRRAPQGTCAKKQHLRIFANKSALFSHPVCPTSRLLQFIAPIELGSFSALKREITFSP